jgi:hypothetical protein
MKTPSFRLRFLAVLGLASLVAACGEPESAPPPAAADLIASAVVRSQLEAVCPPRAMSDGPSFAHFETTVGELGLEPDAGAPMADPRYREIQDSRWVVNDRAPSGEGGAQGRTTLWIGRIAPGVHDFRFATIPDKDGRNIRGGWDGERRRFTSAISCVLHIEGATREDAAAIRREYGESFYDGMRIGVFPGTASEAAPLGLFAEHRWVNGNNPDQYVETDLLAPKPGETGVTLVRRYVFW